MFLRLFGYSVLRTLRQKDIIFWSLIFPIILGTLFQAGFGSYIDTVESRQIDVACVAGEEAQEPFAELLNQLETESELVKVVYTSQKEAERLLKKEKIAGIYFNNEKEVSLMVSEEGIDESILKSILEQYNRTADTFANIMTSHPEGMEQAVQALEGEWNYLRQEDVTDRNVNAMVDYFYALLAMSCLYGCFMGTKCAVEFKADLSELAARRIVASTNRFVILCAEVSSKVLLQFCCTVVGAAYLKYVLKIDLGTETLRMLVIMLVGSLIGVLTGLFISSIGKGSAAAKEGLSTGVTMVECFLSGLMIFGIVQLLEEYAPIVNRINPATLIVKAFYSLNIYEGYARYNQCIVSLLVIALILGAGSYLLVRRERYASI